MLSPAVSRRSAAQILILFLAGCGIDPGPIGAACADDEACISARCLVHESFPDNYCTGDCSADESGCPEGSSCADMIGERLCLKSCGADDECRGGYVCNYATCRPPCVDDQACRAPDTCVASHCWPPCKTDPECPAKHRCKEKKCTFFCEVDEDCPEQRCQDGQCLPPCKADPECLPGYTCNPENGRCDEKPGKKLGEACASASECATGYCLPTRAICSIKCTAGSQCPSGWTCGLEKIDTDKNSTFDQVEADCVPVKGSGAAGALCEKDEDCASSHCYDGFCMQACATDADCGAAGQCLPVNIVLDGGRPRYQGCLPRQGVSNYLIGTVSGSPSTHNIDIPPNAQSFVVTAQVDSVNDMPIISQLLDPETKLLTSLNNLKDPCKSYGDPIRYEPAEQISSIYVPNSPAVKIKPGRYMFMTASTNLNLKVTVRLQLKLGKADKGSFNINWFFLNLGPAAGFCIEPTLNAASAPTHPWLSKVRGNMSVILKNAGLTVGKETFQDIADPALDYLEIAERGPWAELQQLFSSSKGMQGNSINLFIVRKISISGMFGGVVLGLAGGIPGPLGTHGTVHSGIALSAETACFEKWGYNTGHTVAHEIGHYLGLYHSVEEETHPGFQDGRVVCPCPCGAGLSCYAQSGYSWCRGEDPIADSDTSPRNLMYYAAESTQMFEGNHLSPGQIRVLLDSPLVGH